MLRFVCLCVFYVFSLCLPLQKTQAQGLFHDVTIVVSSCDKYAALWPGFFQLLFQKWPSLTHDNKDVPIFLITNKKKYEHSRVQIIHFPNERSWSDNIIGTLQQVKTPYVLFLLDDYFITHFDEQRMLDLVNVMRKDQRVAYIQLSVDQPHDKAYPTLKGLYYKKRHMPFRNALQATLWKTKDFLHLLKSGESPWQFEDFGSHRSDGLERDFLIVSEQQPLAYLNMCYVGYLQYDSMKQAEKIGVTIEKGSIPLDKDHYWALFWKTHLRGMVSRWKESIKSFLKWV